MIPHSVVVLLACVASVALAGNDDRPLAGQRPIAAATAVSLGSPLDLSPMPAYPPVAPGPSQTISGQCYVVTDGGQRSNLAQVEVCIYPQSEFDWYAREVDVRSKARFEAMKSIACPENFAALSLPEMDRSLAAAEVLRHDLHVVWQALPTAAARTKTDAAGRFSVTHRVAPPYVVFAVGSRALGDATEYYRWQIPSGAIPDSLQVVLSNDRLR